MAIRTVVVGFEQDDGLVDRIKAVLDDGDAEVIVARTDEELEAVVDKADVLFGGVLRPDLIEKAGRLKWFQTNSAGVGNVASPELADSGITVTNMSGRSRHADFRARAGNDARVCPRPAAGGSRPGQP